MGSLSLYLKAGDKLGFVEILRRRWQYMEWSGECDYTKVF